MQTMANRIAAVKTSAARTGETGTFITFDTPEIENKKEILEISTRKKLLSIFFFNFKCIFSL